MKKSESIKPPKNREKITMKGDIFMLQHNNKSMEIFIDVVYINKIYFGTGISINPV